MFQSDCKGTKINNKCKYNVCNESPRVSNHDLSQDESTNKIDDRYILDIRHSVVSLKPSSIESLTTTSKKSDIHTDLYLKTISKFQALNYPFIIDVFQNYA